MLNNVYILGGVTDRKRMEKIIESSSYPLSVSNLYTGNDMVLKHLLALCRPEVEPIGLVKI